MPIRDQAAMERSLDNDYGTTRAPSSPDGFEVALFMGDPMIDGIEVTPTTEVDDGAGGITVVSNGYARATLSNDDWLPAADGLKSTSGPVTFPAVLAEYPDTVTHWGLYDPTGAAWWDVAPLSEPLEVGDAGDGPTVVLTVFYDDNLDY